MQAFEFSVDKPVNYHFTGKFESPSKFWIHDNAPLTDYELFVMTKGSMYLSYNYENFQVNEGEILLLPPLPPPHNRRIGYRPSECSFYWMHFSCEAKVSSINMTSQLQTEFLLNQEKKVFIPRHCMLPQTDRIIVLMKQLQDAIRLGHNSFALDYMSTVILCEIHHQFSALLNHTSSQVQTQKQIYNDIMDYVKLNTHVKLTVSHIAEHFGYNEKYLSHLFSTISQMPLKQFILKNKIDAANFLLTDTNMSIREIAASLGFTDNHHFMKCYKKVTGLTPSEYRNAFAKRLLYHK